MPTKDPIMKKIRLKLNTSYFLKKYLFSFETTLSSCYELEIVLDNRVTLRAATSYMGYELF